MDIYSQCTQLLVNWFKNAKVYPEKFHGFDLSIEGDNLQRQQSGWLLACNPDMWKLEEEYSHTSPYFGSGWPTGNFETRQLDDQGNVILINRLESEFVHQWHYICGADKLDRQVSYLVLQDKSGSLVIGDQTGDEEDLFNI